MHPVYPQLSETEALLDAEGRALPVALFRDDTTDSLIIVTRWTLSEEERARVTAGEDLYVFSLSDRNELQVFSPSIGAPSALTDAIAARPDDRDYSSANTVPTDSEGAE